jgi:hypothetical protein
MAKKSAIKIDARKFMSFLKKLHKEFRPPVSLGKVIEGEILAVLKGSSTRTKRTTKARAGGKYNPTSKFYKGWVKLNGKKYYCGPTKNGLRGFRYGNALWAQLQKRLKENRKRAETRVGLSKAVYYRVAADLSLKRYGNGWQQSAAIKTSYLKSGGLGSPAKSGPVWGTRKVAKTTKSLRGNNPKISFSITSTNTINPFTGGAGAVKAAMGARQKNFQVAMEKGAFKSTKMLAGFYPNIKVKM